MKTTKLLWILALASIIAASCSKKPTAKDNSEQTVCVKTETIAETTASMPIHCSGMLTSKRISKLSFKTGGIINQLLVDEGSTVRKGQLLATLNMTEISAQVQQARVAFEKAERDFKRVQNLYADTVVPLEQLQNANSAYQAALEAKNIAEFNLQYSRIVAPANGKIISKLAAENELTGAGMPVLVFSEEGNDDWIIKTGISDKDAVLLSLGDKGNITFDAFGNQPFEAKVSKLAQTADPTSGTFEIELAIKPQGYKFIHGLVADVRINSTRTQVVSLVPPDAVVEANGNKGYVYVVDKENPKAKKISVTIAYTQSLSIAVLERLNNMGRVITKGAAYLEDGARINEVR